MYVCICIMRYFLGFILYIIFLLIICSCIDEEYMLVISKDYLNGNNKGIWSLYLIFFLNV